MKTPSADESTSRTTYQVLGHVAAANGTKRLELGGRKQRLVLAVLLANVNKVVTQDSLIEAVWSDEPTRGGARTLHTYISTLRKVVGPDSIFRQADGYVLAAEPQQLDALQFRALVDEARPLLDDQCEYASELLRQALGLWKGPPYGDLGFDEALITDAAQLREERVIAQEMRFEADLSCGRHEALVPEIETAALENPYRERLVGLLMVALYRSGRQAEALRAFTRLRVRLRDELGIDPSTDVQELESKILEQDPGLDAPSLRKMEHSRPAARGYELHEAMGTSSRGTRYRSFQAAIGREVSVLVIDKATCNSSQFIRSFQPEMQIAAAFEHPHLSPVFDYWRDPNEACVVGPHLQGGSLASRVTPDGWPLIDVVRVGDQIAAALGYLHRNEYAHGAVDSHSVYIDDDVNAYLSDTGLAHIIPGSPSPTLSADIFALGQLLFELLKPGQSEEKTLAELRPDLPEELSHALARAMHPDPDSRFARVEDFARALKQSAGFDVGPVPSTGRAAGKRRNPYKGLRAFQETDATDFHGRRVLVSEMVGALSKARMLTVVGPSGSGKSSAVRAGLIPEIRNGAIPGSMTWAITDMFPGTHPFEELESALLRVAIHRPADLGQVLASDPEGLVRMVPELTESDNELLIVIDQFEELFSLVSSVDERRRFLEALTVAATHPESSVRLILTLRADFFDQPLEHTEFADVMTDNLVTVSPPSPEGLAAAVAQPALDAGVGLEPGLVPRIVEEVRQEPGGLPLLQYAMTEMFEARDGEVMTIGGYERIGGVAGALANRAEEIYMGLTSEGREFARQLFLRLVAVDEHTDDTRRRIRQSEVTSVGFNISVVRSVIERFGAFRLLSFDRDPITRTPTVELAHESLLKEWERLHSWIDERREDLVVHRRLQVAAFDWAESDHDPSYLIRGSRLDQALGFLETTDMSIAEDELALVDASIAEQAREQAEREALEHRAARRRRLVVGVSTGAAIVASVLGLYALGQRESALVNAALATSRELSLASKELADDDPELSMLLALEAIAEIETHGRQPPAETLSALWYAYTRQRVEVVIDGAGFLASTFSPEGDILATDLRADQRAVALWDSRNGVEVGRLDAAHLEGTADGDVVAIEFTPDGESILVSRAYSAGAPETVVAVDVYNATSSQKVASLTAPRGRYDVVDISGDGHVMASSYQPIVTSIWDLAAGEAPIAVFDGVYSEAFLSDTTLLSRRVDNSTELVELDWETTQDLRSIPIDLVPWRIAASKDRNLVAVADEGNQVAIYEVATGQGVLEPTPYRNPLQMTWKPDGSELALSGNDADVTIIDPLTGETLLSLSGHESGVFSTAWDASGDRVATLAESRAARIWNVSGSGPAHHGNISVDVWGILDPIPAGTGFLRSVPLSHVDVLDPDGVVQASHDFHPLFPVLGVISGNGKVFGGDYASGEAATVDIDTGTTTQLPECASLRALSWNGSLAVITPSFLVSCDPGLPAGVIDVETGTYLFDIGADEILLATFSTEETLDGRYVALVSVDVSSSAEDPDTYLEVWSLNPLQQLASIPDTRVEGLSLRVPRFSQDAHYLGVGTGGPRALVVDVEALTSGASVDEAILFNQEVHNGNTIRAIPNSTGLLVTMGHDGFYRFWDIDSGELRMEIDERGLTGALSHGFSRDEETIYYMAETNLISQIPTDPQEIIRQARASVTRPMSDDECSQYLHTAGCG